LKGTVKTVIGTDAAALAVIREFNGAIRTGQEDLDPGSRGIEDLLIQIRTGQLAAQATGAKGRVYFNLVLFHGYPFLPSLRIFISVLMAALQDYSNQGSLLSYH
jgi:hypothetical protein